MTGVFGGINNNKPQKVKPQASLPNLAKAMMDIGGAPSDFSDLEDYSSPKIDKNLINPEK